MPKSPDRILRPTTAYLPIRRPMFFVFARLHSSQLLHFRLLLHPPVVLRSLEIYSARCPSPLRKITAMRVNVSNVRDSGVLFVLLCSALLMLCTRPSPNIVIITTDS